VDHVTVFRWVRRLTPLLADAARFCRHAVGDRWFVDETYVKVKRPVALRLPGSRPVRAEVIDVYVSPRQDAAAARRFFVRALTTMKVTPVEVVTDRAAVYRGVLEELLPAAQHNTERYRNNRIESDHGRLKQSLMSLR
jgi:transposase-like protein